MSMSSVTSCPTHPSLRSFQFSVPKEEGKGSLAPLPLFCIKSSYVMEKGGGLREYAKKWNSPSHPCHLSVSRPGFYGLELRQAHLVLGLVQVHRGVDCRGKFIEDGKDGHKDERNDG